MTDSEIVLAYHRRESMREAGHTIRMDEHMSVRSVYVFEKKGDRRCVAVGHAGDECRATEIAWRIFNDEAEPDPRTRDARQECLSLEDDR